MGHPCSTSRVVVLVYTVGYWNHMCGLRCFFIFERLGSRDLGYTVPLPGPLGALPFRRGPCALPTLAPQPTRVKIDKLKAQAANSLGRAVTCFYSRALNII